MRTIAVFALSIVSLFTQAQNVKTSTIRWESDKQFNIATGETLDASNKIVSTSASSIAWQKPNGTNQLFTVSEAIGNWTTVTSNGTMVYEISNATSRGNITFEKNSGGTLIRLLLIEGEEEPLIYELTIVNI